MEVVSETPTCTLCLNMIVKNESKIITRLLDSVISIIDCYCICDTGSTDNTIQVIEDYFKQTSISGKIVQEPFQNFCHNRNVALNACVGMSDYVLLLDADMILEIKNFQKSKLRNYDSYNILQGSDAFYYQNLRIVKNNGQYKYVGVTHEYIDRPSNNTISSLPKEALFIRDIGDGGCKQNKFERDIRLLLEGITKEPNNHRYFFYLANSYHDLGRYNEAIYWYKKRIESGGWIEEVWYSYYRIGLCYKKTEDMANALWYWLEGYNYYPARLEGLYEALHYCRNTSKHKLGLVFYKMCKEVLDKKMPRSDHLFLYEDVYTFLIYYEYSIIAAYCGIYNINHELIQILNHSRGGEISNVLCNMKFYKFILNPSYKIIMDHSIESNIQGEKVTFTSSSSCMIPKPTLDGFYMNIRYVNYHITENGSYIHCDKHIITMNERVELDGQLQIIKREMMPTQVDGRRYMGVEDIRIFYNDSNQLMFIGTGFHASNQIGVVYGAYEGEMTPRELTQQFQQTHCEKNWVFVNYNKSTHIIYNWYPLHLCKINETDQTIEKVETKCMPRLFTRVRGSTCGFEYKKQLLEPIQGGIRIHMEESEIWFVTHLVSYENPRHYYHVLVVFDSQMNLLRYSAPFKFEGDPIEYCLSIIVEDEHVYMNYSTWDRTTRIAVYDKKYIDGLLVYS